MIFAYIDPGTGFTISSIGGWLAAFGIASLGIASIAFKKLFSNFKRAKLIAVIVIACIILVAIAGGIFFMSPKAMFEKKIVILGFDGLTSDILDPMMAAGNLPNFSRLANEGAYKRLATTNPPQSPVAWAAFATGKNPAKNGVYDFIIRDPKTYQLSLSLSNMEGTVAHRVIKTTTLWEYLSQRHIPAAVITCPLTFPSMKIVGRMLSGMGVPDILGTEGTFTFYTSAPSDIRKDVGGKVFSITRSDLMVMDLIGPRVRTIGGAKNAKVPFKVTITGDKDAATIEFQGKKFMLAEGRWSDWQGVVFNVGPFRKMNGVCKFYLVQTYPHFKLYISPINFDPRLSFVPLSYPVGYAKELAGKIGIYHTLGMPIDTWSVNEGRLGERELIDMASEVFREKEAMLNAEMDRFKNGVLFCYFGSADTIQHMFWRYRDPQHPAYPKDEDMTYQLTIESWYMKLDSVLGNVMARSGKDDLLIVMSDHGFNSFRRAVHVNAWLKENGYLSMMPHADASKTGLLRDIDWENTKAYALGFGAIYLNLKGRERNGIVALSDAAALTEEIAERLRKWNDPKTSTPVVAQAYLRDELFDGPYAYKCPDLYIGFNVGYRASWQTALGGVPGTTIDDNMKKWSGDHLFDPRFVPGILLMNRKIEKDAPSIYDLTPTVLKECGFSAKDIERMSLDGESLL